MDKHELKEVYGEVVDQIAQHLKRGALENAQAMHARFCADILSSISSMGDQISFFVKDITIAFADKIDFTQPRHTILIRLSNGTDDVELEAIRASMVMRLKAGSQKEMDERVMPAWRCLVESDPRSAVAVIALVHRLFVEKKLAKLVRAEARLEESVAEWKPAKTKEE